MKLSEKIKLILRLPITLIQRVCYSKPKVMSDFETVKYICDNNCSISRFGDGELDIMYGIGIKFQDADKILQQRLKEIAQDGSQTTSLVCIPDMFYTSKGLKNKFVLKDAKWWGKCLRITRGMWYKNFRAKFYGDANISRFYMELNNKTRTADYVKELRKIWDGKDIVFVEGSKSRLGMGNDLFDNASSVRRILCPSRNAFDKYDEILTKVLDLTNENDLIICALGPTATVLSYDLSKQGRRSLDLGHVDIEYEWYLAGVLEKTEVKGKDMSETSSAFNEDNSKLPTNVIAEIV